MVLTHTKLEYPSLVNDQVTLLQRNVDDFVSIDLIPSAQ